MQYLPPIFTRKIVDLRWSQRMVDPLITGEVDVCAGAERLPTLDVLGTLVSQRTLGPRERHCFVVVLEQILPDLRSNRLEKETEMGE